MTNFSTHNPSGKGPGGDVPPNPFSSPSDLPAVPAIPGLDVSASKGSPITLHGLLMIVVIVIAGAALWGMRFIGMGSARSASAVTTDYDLQAITTAGNDHQALLMDLNAIRTTNQVDNEELKKNPFELSRAARPVAQTPDGPVDDDQKGENAAMALARPLQEEFARFRLQGVMNGVTPIARIDGQVYRVGDKVGRNFTIASMEGRTVTLTADGKPFVLTMDR